MIPDSNFRYCFVLVKPATFNERNTADKPLLEDQDEGPSETHSLHEALILTDEAENQRPFVKLYTTARVRERARVNNFFNCRFCKTCS